MFPQKMVRRLAAAVLTVSGSVPLLASALSLGDVELESNLNQPFKATIDLMKEESLNVNEILVGLASISDFEASGIDRSFVLSNLQFEVEEMTGGEKRVVISSSKPISEPFLNFLVEVHWPAGRLLREYTVLLDPPAYGNGMTSQDASDEVGGDDSEESVQDEVVKLTNDSKNTQNQTAFTNTIAAKKQGKSKTKTKNYVTQNGDMLWNIAQEMRMTPDVTIQQVMLAIQKKNPHAFISNNINLLRKGVVIETPTEDDVMSLSRSEAVDMVAHQNKKWKERIGVKSKQELKKSVYQGVDSNYDDAGNIPDTEEGRLRLASGNKSGDAPSNRQGDGSSSHDLFELQETLAAKQLQLDDITSELNELNAQYDETQELIKLKNDNIVLMQQELDALQSKEDASLLGDMSDDLAQGVDDVSDSVGDFGNELGDDIGNALDELGGLLDGQDDTSVEGQLDGLVQNSLESETDAFDELSPMDELFNDDSLNIEDAEEQFLDTSEQFLDNGEQLISEGEQLLDDSEQLLGDDAVEQSDSEAIYGDEQTENEGLPAVVKYGLPLGAAGAIGLFLFLSKMRRKEDEETQIEFEEEGSQIINTESNDKPDADEFNLEESILVESSEDSLSNISFEESSDINEDISLEIDDLPTLDELEDELESDFEEMAISEESSISNVALDPTIKETKQEIYKKVDETIVQEVTNNSIDFTASQPAEPLKQDIDSSPNSKDEKLASETLEYENVSTTQAEFEEARSEPLFRFDEDYDEIGTKLDLAKAYIDIGDKEGAKDIVDEVLRDGNAQQKEQANKLLQSLS